MRGKSLKVRDRTQWIQNIACGSCAGGYQWRPAVCIDFRGAPCSVTSAGREDVRRSCSLAYTRT